VFFFLFQLAHKSCFCFNVCTVCLFIVYHLVFKPMNPKVAADIQSYFHFKRLCLNVCETAFSLLLYSAGHGETVWLLQVNTQVRCELEEGRVNSRR
jgi:hypothetical protein